MKFAHLGDCHLGGWRQPELKELSMKSFQYALERCIKENVDFILISGDLFDSAYPPIETLKETFSEFRKIKEAKIPVFIIAGSHDYSAAGKTFLDVLEHSGFCKNVSLFEERNGDIYLHPTIYQNVAIYGYPGKKTGLEVQDIERIKLHDSPGMFKILMLHTAIRDAVGTLPIPAVDETKLPKVDYLALSHLHILYQKENRVYSGPTFSNNLTELEELHAGSFCIYSNGKIKRERIKLKEVLSLHVEVSDALNATSQILSLLEKQALKDKIVIFHITGIIQKGRISDIDFNKIENFVRKNGAYSFLKSTIKLVHADSELEIDLSNSTNLEDAVIEKFISSNQSKYNSLIPELIRALQIEQMTEEKGIVFEERLYEEVKKHLKL